MPIYEYECCGCGTKFERRQTFDENPVANCPRCAAKARRVIHAVPVVFKGSGFYCTDHGRGSNNSTSSKDKEAEPRTEAKSEAKSEAKPEAKAEAKASTDHGESD